MKNSTSKTHYQVRVNNGSWLSNEGYSKFYERYKMSIDGIIEAHEVYGYDQALEHIKEYFSTQDEYTEKRAKHTLTIERVNTKTTEVSEHINVYNN